jgi:hypothetical protein
MPSFRSREGQGDKQGNLEKYEKNSVAWDGGCSTEQSVAVCTKGAQVELCTVQLPSTSAQHDRLSVNPTSSGQKTTVASDPKQLVLQAS